MPNSLFVFEISHIELFLLPELYRLMCQNLKTGGFQDNSIAFELFDFGCFTNNKKKNLLCADTLPALSPAPDE